MGRTLNKLPDDGQKAYRKLARVVRRLLDDQPSAGPDAGREVFRKAVGEAVMVVRLHRDMSQVRLAGELSVLIGKTVPQAYVSKVETGTKPVSAKRLAVFCTALRCTLDRVYALAAFLAKQNFRPDKQILRDVIRRTG